MLNVCCCDLPGEKDRRGGWSAPLLALEKTEYTPVELALFFVSGMEICGDAGLLLYR